MADFFIVNEASLLRLLWLAWRGLKPGFIDVRPLLPPLKLLLERVAQRLARSGLAIDVIGERPDLVACGNFGDFIRLNDSFATTEPWMEEHYAFAEAERNFGDYAYAYRHVVSNRANHYPFLAHTIETIVRQSGSDEVSVRGVGRDILDVYRFRIGEPPRSVRAAIEARLLVNALLASVAFIHAMCWAVSRTRLRPTPPKTYFLGSDFVGDPRQQTLWRELADAENPVFVVLRNRSQAAAFRQLLDGWPSCVATEGVIPLTRIPAFLRDLLRETWSLYRRGRRFCSEVFWDLIRLPFRRAMYRALLNRYRFRNFWARDEYNVEHIIRTQELRRIGARHFGQLHGLPAYPPVLAQRRYISLDVYYVFGPEWHQKHYLDRWPADMTVKAVGSYGMSREQLVRLREPRPKDILCFIKHSFQDDATFAILPRIAAAFPDRTVYVKPKQQKSGAFRAKLDRMLAEGPKNLVETDEDSYELLFKGQYSLSDPSSLVVEAIQFGLVSFALITDPRWYKLYFRDFPDLCLTSAEDVISRIEAIERGEWTYPRSRYAPLTDLSGRVIWDVIRADMGLAPKQREPLPHLNFLEDAGVTRRRAAVGTL